MTISAVQTASVKRWLGMGLAGIVTLAFAVSAAGKLAHVSMVVQQLTGAGLPQATIIPIGILELACLTLYLIPRTAILGTILLSGYLGGAIVIHIIARENFAPPFVVGLMMLVSSYLRHGELQALLPFKRT